MSDELRILNFELKKILMALVCVMAGICCRAQIIISKVMVGDSLTNLSTQLYEKNVPDSDMFVHIGILRRGHACIDWTLRGAVTIPDSLTFNINGKTYPIAVVSFHAFYRCVGLTEVTLPPTVKMVGSEAFYGCAALEKVHLSDGLLMLEERTFAGCSSLREVTLPCSVPPRGSINAFDASTYEKCTLMVPQGCSAAYRNAELWSHFVRIEEMEDEGVMPDDLDYDKWEKAMNFMDSFLEDEMWRMPQRVETDVAWTINIMTSEGSREVVFSSRSEFDMAVVGSGLANECCIDTTFAGRLALPDSVTAPDGRRYVVGGVAMSAFSGCKRLQQVDMPPHLEFIDNLAFYDCKALRQVVIPANMKEIMSSAFVGCNGLNRVVTLAQRPPDLFVDAFDDRIFNTATLVLPEGATEAYMATDAWPLFKYRMENVDF
ncbi:MAG: leucine-rich repeat protein [Prevotella sp.]|nr:leucine-rich repeat protein [Prevotella sp.]